MTDVTTTTTPEHSATRLTFPFSLEQWFLRLQHETDGSSGGFGPRPVSSGGWRLTGPLDLVALQRALGDIVARHEPLRTSIVESRDGWRQEVREPREPRLVIHDIAPDQATPPMQAAERFLMEAESDGVDLADVPCLQARLGRLGEDDAVLVLLAHLPVVDVWSLGLVLRDLVHCYDARLRDDEPAPLDVATYREYVAWQEENPGAGAPPDAFEHWRHVLDGSQAVVLRADRPSATDGVSGTRCDRFVVDRELGSAVLALARSTRSTPFMVVFAIYRLHLLRLTGIRDGVVWTLTTGPGRRRRWLEETTGYFVNMCPLRTDVTGCTTFRAVVERVRTACLRTYQNEVPFVRLAQEASQAIGGLEVPGMVVPGIQVVPPAPPLREPAPGGLACTPIARRLSQPVGPDIPEDAILWTIEVSPEGELVCAVHSSIDRFDADSVEAMISDFLDLLRWAVERPDDQLPLDLLPS